MDSLPLRKKGDSAMAKKKRRVEVHQERFPFSCAQIFPLLCPVKEDDWIPGWREQREMIYTESGTAEVGCVFITRKQPHLMGPATWVNNVYDPNEKIQYSAINEHMVYQIQGNLKPLPAGCEVTLTRTWTALTPQAEEFLGRMADDAAKAPPKLFELIAHYLKTGKMLSL
jgi:hypothetical protein